MKSSLRSILLPLFNENKYERKKVLLLSLSFMFIIGAFSILKPLKNSIFFALVGGDYQPYTRYISLGLLPILMLTYSYAVDHLRRHQVFIIMMSTYVVGILFSSWILQHPVYGLTNTETSPYRLFGWFFYIAMDFFPIFIVSTFWAFSNSITDTKSAKHNYGLIVAFSKAAGFLTPLLSHVAINNPAWEKSTVLPLVIAASALSLFCATLMISYLKKSIPGRYLHGYEAVYALEKAKEEKPTKKKAGIFEGIKLMVTKPYVFGIFGMVYSYEIISAIFDYQMNVLSAVQTHNNIYDMSSFQLVYTSIWQFCGGLFAIIGTTSLINYLDIQKCLLIVPSICGLIGIFLFVYPMPNLTVMLVIMVILRAMNYGFNVPLREILYIPTIKDIKFKSKAWTDSFGRTLSKTSGSTINLLSVSSTTTTQIMNGSIFAMSVAGIWLMIATFLGKKYTKTVKNNSVIK